jgi:stage 0 sporulation regulatory protein
VDTHMLEENKYLYRIQKKRQEMMELGKKLGLTHEKTVQCSQQLDSLMNEYEAYRKQYNTRSSEMVIIREMSFILYEKVQRLNLAEARKTYKAMQIV